ncbi:hypothetical protein VTN49DRAFT_3959 [Thermomyces lanuginosus]|uniref:uncharacterized protein n=1 Tax=Thermomyces lanuginosus TaxID=5541 RepID=UPI003744811A
MRLRIKIIYDNCQTAIHTVLCCLRHCHYPCQPQTRDEYNKAAKMIQSEEKVEREPTTNQSNEGIKINVEEHRFIPETTVLRQRQGKRIGMMLINL